MLQPDGVSKTYVPTSADPFDCQVTSTGTGRPRWRSAGRDGPMACGLEAHLLKLSQVGVPPTHELVELPHKEKKHLFGVHPPKPRWKNNSETSNLDQPIPGPSCRGVQWKFVVISCFSLVSSCWRAPKETSEELKDHLHSLPLHLRKARARFGCGNRKPAIVEVQSS